MKAAKSEEVERLLATHARPVRVPARAACALVLDAVPNARLGVRFGWRLVGFYAPRHFAFVAPQDDHVRLGSEHGVILGDLGLLEGSGRQVRHVPIRGADTLRDPRLRVLVLKAADHGRDASPRRRPRPRR